jgi:uncharacterized repeat protein (TIGR01451 family)
MLRSPVAYRFRTHAFITAFYWEHKMRHYFASVLLFAAFASLGTVAFARPIVALKLTAAIVQKDTNGRDVLAPASGGVVHAGDRMRYEIVASNAGDRPATNVRPTDKIPAGTEFVAGSASGNGKVEYSLDRGVSWSSAPTVVVHSKDGDKTVPADPATYTAVRWTTMLKPGAAETFAFDVSVK